MITNTTATKQHYYKGWTFQMVKRNHWILVRTSDGFTTDHNSYDGCKIFIRNHGNAANPDAHYEEFVSSKVIPATAA